jgi:hypothetical protein
VYCRNGRRFATVEIYGNPEVLFLHPFGFSALRSCGQRFEFQIGKEMPGRRLLTAGDLFLFYKIWKKFPAVAVWRESRNSPSASAPTERM